MLDFATRIGVKNNQSFAFHFVGNLLLYQKKTGQLLMILLVSSATAAASRHGFWTRIMPSNWIDSRERL